MDLNKVVMMVMSGFMLVVVMGVFFRFGRFSLMEQRQINQFSITPLLDDLGHDAQGNFVAAPGLDV
jgi:hypothetical protein